MKYDDALIIQFAKWPVPGQVKTRLIPALGEDVALAAHKQLLLNTLSLLAHTQLCDVELWFDKPAAADHPFPEVLRFLRGHGVRMGMQSGTDLGERMHHALQQRLSSYRRVIIVGSDCPVLYPHYLENALQYLNHVDTVLGPAEDGGYVLLGATRAEPAMFNGIDWGTDQVLAQTLERLEQAGRHVHLLDELWDVDRPPDYQRWQKVLNG